MTAKKTTVTLPGGLAGLVHAAQQGGAKAPATAATTPAADSGADTTRPDSAQPETQSAPTEATAAPSATAGSPKAAAWQPRRAPQEASALAAEAISDDYRRAIAAGESRWQLFEQLARQYHRASGLSAVYIDDDLKRALARLRASGMGVSASAILSAIVRQFLIENADSVRDTIGQP